MKCLCSWQIVKVLESFPLILFLSYFILWSDVRVVGRDLPYRLGANGGSVGLKQYQSPLQDRCIGN
jgi:hypothetical protein